MIKKFGFTLAEVLITLGIIGVVAAMTIPTLMQRTNDAELKSGFKKMMSVLNQAISMNYALDGVDLGGITQNGNLSDTQGTTFLGFVGQRLNVVGQEGNEVYFSDGSSIISYDISECDKANALGNAKCYIEIDVNGKKGPNKATTATAAQLDANQGTLNDRYTVYGYKRTIAPLTTEAGGWILVH